MEVRFGRASELLSPEEEVLIVRVGGVSIVERLDLLRLLEEIPYLDEAEADRLGLEAKRWSRKRS